MKTKHMLKYIFPVVFLFVACTETKKETEQPKKNETVVAKFANESAMDDRAFEIDAMVNDADKIANSLRYTKEDGTSVEVLAYLNKEDVILKIEELFSEGNGKTNGKRTFYLNNGKPFLSREEIDQITNGTGVFIDRISYYSTNNQVIKTKERSASYQEEVERLAYKPIGLKAASIDRAMRALNSEKEFETTFQGFADQDAFTYLIVGENAPNGFSTAMRCDFKDELVNTLLTNPEKYLGKKVKVNFQKFQMEDGFEFQVYAGGRFVN